MGIGPRRFSFPQLDKGGQLTESNDRILPEEFYKLLMHSITEQLAMLKISVDATEEDFVRQLLRIITSLHQVRRMLTQHDPRLKEMIGQIIEEDDYSDPELETRRAERDELSQDFLDDVEIDPTDFRLAETLVLLGQSTGSLPPLDTIDLVQKFSREALGIGLTVANQAGECEEVFVHRIVSVINGEMARSSSAVKALT